jgi:hypothetical protein
MIASAITRFRATVVLTTLGFFLTFAPLISQIDSVKQGTITVRRAPVPSDYYVKFDYNYHGQQHGFLHHLFNREDSSLMAFAPPDPVAADPNVNDTNETLLDSSFMITFYNKQGRPTEEFDWITWLDQYEHTFDWDDSSGIDSTLFIFEVNPRGQVNCVPVAMSKDDSSALVLQKNLIPLMKKLWIWYPASTITDEGKRQKKVSCTVVVKVYAVRIGEGQRLPLKIVD